MDKQLVQKICNRIDTYESDCIELQKELTSRPAIGPESDGEGEIKKSEFLNTFLKNELRCDEIIEIKAPDKRVPVGFRPNLIAKFTGKSSSRTLWILSHMDVVPPGDLSKWSGDPWTIRVEDGKIYGRGTEDNQQGIVSSILAVKAFKDEELSSEMRIGLIFVADEETGSKYGLQYILENRSDLFSENDFFIIPDTGNADGTLLEIAEKSIVQLKFRVLGKQTHASTPKEGINAMRAGANLIVQLEHLYMIYNASDPVFDPPLSTFEPTKKEANIPNINTIPGEDIFYYDCRLLPSYDVEHFKVNVERICQEIETKYHVKVEVSSEIELVAAPPTAVDVPVVRALQRAIRELRNITPTPKGIGGGTVAAFLRKAGFDAVVWGTQDETLHGPDEYAQIDNILADAKVFAHVALQS